MEGRPADPFTAPEPESLKLASCPVVRALFQVQFSPVEGIAAFEGASPFHEAMRSAYPMFAREERRDVTLTPQGPVMRAVPVWRMQDVMGTWRISLAPDMMGVETASYVSRTDFLARIGAALDALAAHVGPQAATRHGVRYVNRMQAGPPAGSHAVFADGVAGEGWLAASALPEAVHASSQLAGKIEGGGVANLRWGVLPPGSTHDPEMMAPAPWRACFLDVDVHSETAAQPLPFSPTASLAEARRLSGRCHAAFRWAVSDVFLTEASKAPPAYAQPGVWQAGTAALH